MIEQNIKTLIGEYVFQICILQDQLERANKKVSDLEEQLREKND